ncbi:MAG: DUF4019 domain-containing protein [Gemmatimonadaceae bacterium]
MTPMNSLDLQSEKSESDAPAESWLGLVDAGKSAESWRAAGAVQRDGVSAETWAEEVGRVRAIACGASSGTSFDNACESPPSHSHDAGGTQADFFAWLRSIPTNTGDDVFERRMSEARFAGAASATLPIADPDFVDEEGVELVEMAREVHRIYPPSDRVFVRVPA